MYSDKKSGRTVQQELDEEKSALLLNRRVGEVIDGTPFGLNGYKLKITGGSDNSGFPMDKSIQGAAKIKVFKKLSTGGKRKGQLKRRTVRGNSINQDTAQVNCVIEEYGSTPIDQLMPKKEEAKAEEENKG